MERQNILLILLIIILGGIAFVWYQYLGTLPAGSAEEQVEFEPEIAELERLATVDLSLDILENPLFQSLEAPLTLQEAASSSTRKGNPFLSF